MGGGAVRVEFVRATISAATATTSAIAARATAGHVVRAWRLAGLVDAGVHCLPRAAGSSKPHRSPKAGPPPCALLIIRTSGQFPELSLGLPPIRGTRNFNSGTSNGTAANHRRRHLTAPGLSDLSGRYVHGPHQYGCCIRRIRRRGRRGSNTPGSTALLPTLCVQKRIPLIRLRTWRSGIGLSNLPPSNMATSRPAMRETSA